MYINVNGVVNRESVLLSKCLAGSVAWQREKLLEEQTRTRAAIKACARRQAAARNVRGRMLPFAGGRGW